MKFYVITINDIVNTIFSIVFKYYLLKYYVILMIFLLIIILRLYFDVLGKKYFVKWSKSVHFISTICSHTMNNTYVFTSLYGSITK